MKNQAGNVPEKDRPPFFENEKGLTRNSRAVVTRPATYTYPHIIGSASCGVEPVREPVVSGLLKEHMDKITNFEKVEDFMQVMGQEVKTLPEIPDAAVSELRVDMLDEEVQELRDAIEKGCLVEIADALTDILYVTYGTGHSFGVDLDECMDEVHGSNMSKPEDGVVLKRDDGKVLKGKNYYPPDLESILGIKKV